MPEVINVLAGQTVKLIKISDIKIEHRQRSLDPQRNEKEFKEWMAHIDRLASSIRRAGLLHPVTLEDGTNKLLAGFNRVQAFLRLGRTEIPFVYRSELSDIDRKVIELEENIARLDISFADKVKAIAEIDSLQRQLAGDKGETWTTAKTAEMVGVSVGTVSQAKKVVQHAATIDPSVLKSEGLVSALNKIKNHENLERRKQEVARAAAGQLETFPAEVLVGDALELIRKEPDASFDAVITNFPFGVELQLGNENRHSPYRDDEDYIVKLVRAVTHESYRVLRPDSWMVGFFDVRKITYSNKQRQFVEKTLAFLNKLPFPLQGALEVVELQALAAESLGLTYWMEEAGFDYVQVLPCIWPKPNKTQGKVGDPTKGFVMAYEAFVLAGKGNPQLMKKGRQNIFIYDTVVGADRDIDVQMPTTICQDIVSLVCLGGSRILDPFAGSAAFGEAALSNQCSFRGYEIDPKRAEIGNLRLAEHVRAKGGKKNTPEAQEAHAKMQAYLRQIAEMREGGLDV